MTHLLQTLQNEIDFHTKEINEHKKLAEKTKGKKQKDKATKHFHKRFQTIKIAKKLGFEFCSECGNVK